MSRKGVGNCFAKSLLFRFAIQLETRLETCLQWLLRSLQLEESEQLITMPVKLAMLYTCLSILLTTFNYRVRGTCVATRAFHARLAR